jgi:hypothetical protein
MASLGQESQLVATAVMGMLGPALAQALGPLTQGMQALQLQVAQTVTRKELEDSRQKLKQEILIELGHIPHPQQQQQPQQRAQQHQQQQQQQHGAQSSSSSAAWDQFNDPWNNPAQAATGDVWNDWRPSGCHQQPQQFHQQQPQQQQQQRPRQQQVQTSLAFVPDRVFVRGWSSFENSSSKTEAEAKALDLRIRKLLAPEIIALIGETLTYRNENHKLTYIIAGGREACWNVHKSLNEVLRANCVDDAPLSCAVQQHPEVHRTNGELANFAKALKDWLPNAITSKPVMTWGRNGHIRLNNVMVGRFNIGGEWLWLERNLERVAGPGCDIRELNDLCGL